MSAAASQDNQAQGEVTAAVLVIGDEILSGRTKDKNIGYIADFLTAIGIDLKEVRIVPDEQDEIVSALNALRSRYDYVLTTGGIGPTHDDITADAVARAFGVGISHHPEAVRLIEARVGKGNLNEARLRMARIPHGASLVVNDVSGAPGFRIENVVVMAGVPAIMQSMLDAAAKDFRTGRKMLSLSIPLEVKEGDIADPLRTAQGLFSDVLMGSYPKYADGKFSIDVVMRGREMARIEEAKAAFLTALQASGMKGV
ncbi:MAG: competence/damage-inducible protein A [Flavobacteriaceae bacterium]